MNKCIFLDRDGVINKDFVDYTYLVEKFFILPNVIEGLKKFKKDGYLLVVITNQSGIAKGIYGHQDVRNCHSYFDMESENLIDAWYYSPYHPVQSESLTRKPESLMFEKAIAKFDIDVTQSWMIGDKERDLAPARKLGLKTLQICDQDEGLECNGVVKDLVEAYEFIALKNQKVKTK
ncbi:MAG: HAD-IIIA family hydrolase [Cytophagaceae bacterium]|nr:HAD-IIIA family hydrolase [Cytophagaceae bacterium]